VHVHNRSALRAIETEREARDLKINLAVVLRKKERKNRKKVESGKKVE